MFYCMFYFTCDRSLNVLLLLGNACSVTRLAAAAVLDHMLMMFHVTELSTNNQSCVTLLLPPSGRLCFHPAALHVNQLTLTGRPAIADRLN